MKLQDLIALLTQRSQWGRKHQLSHIECGKLAAQLKRCSDLMIATQEFDVHNETSEPVGAALRALEAAGDIDTITQLDPVQPAAATTP